MPYIGKKPENIIATAVDSTTGTFSGAVSAASVDADGGVTVDNITIDGTEIDLSSGDLTVDVASTIILDADGGEISFYDGGTAIGKFQNSSSDFQIGVIPQDKDIKFFGNDGGGVITAFKLDMSDAGAATLNNGLTLTDGNLVVASGHGIDFSATGNTSASGASMSSELLDDYEEGTWTPAFDDAGGGTFGYSAQSGTYTRIGRLVYCQFNIVVSSISSLSSSILRITGQPFSSNSDENMFVSRYQGFTGGAPHRGNSSGSSSVNMKSEGDNDNGNFPSNRVTSSTQLIGQIMFTAS